MPKERDIKELSKGSISREDPRHMVPNSIDMYDLWEIENLEERSSDILMQDVWAISV
jgi:hypothetical protein